MISAVMVLIPAALAGGLFQVGTGPRPLQAPGTAVLVGGGLRVGPSLGPVTPFVGGTVVRATAKEPSVPVEADVTLWSAIGGLRVDLAGLEKPAQPFLAFGGLVGASTGHSLEGDFEELVWVDMGPGAFAGIGADAAIIPAMRLGVEFGAAGSRGTINLFNDGNKDDLSTQVTGTIVWSYADLHLTFRSGVAK